MTSFRKLYMATESTIKNINRCELNGLIERVEHAIAHDLSLSSQDLKLLLLAITTLCELQERMDEDDVTLYKLRKLLGMVNSSESRRNGSSNKKRNKGNKGNLKKKRPGSKTAPLTVIHEITEYKKGDICPGCNKGKLYKHVYGELLRITGHSPYEATKHVTEQLRCNGCLEVFKAPLPDEVLADGDVNQKYGYSARAVMAINKFYSGTPYNHQENLNDIMGCSISASTIFDQCQHVANAVEPIFDELKRQAANAANFDIDDTHNRILHQEPELRDRRDGKGQQMRSGIYSSGLIAYLPAGHEIILFETSLGHAGEHLDSILQYRTPTMDLPIVMSDALSSNTSKYDVIKSYCNSHCRRLFYDISNNFADQVEWLLDRYAVIWSNDANIKSAHLNPTERLAYHKKHSLPIMEEIRDWANNLLNLPEFEENSAFGKAVKYLLKHYDKLVRFCYVVGAKIDNNRMEERLKIVIRGRKTAYFYKTINGAEVANKLISIIATADTAGINIFDYLCALQRYRVALKQDPIAWLPWNYQQTMAEKEAKLKPDKIV